ncbi:glycerol-3-phosphate acyltransferase, partial [Clostridioides difficile]|uniref:glycerol-3-phosphate acyltransferase n=1 Tax=Clostridioides difficile TaxID=1496 RepID=UPI001EEE9BAF
MEIIKYILYFFIYSFLGWTVESIGCSIASKRIINRGFLNGPICPVYGFGAVIVISLLGRFNNVVIVFLLGMILTTILEYFTGFILETLFHAKWWDYSDRKFNIKGRVCLKNAIYFGVMSVLISEFSARLVGIDTLLAGYLAVICVVAGHNWPAVLGFRGGKGVATSLG